MLATRSRLVLRPARIALRTQKRASGPLRTHNIRFQSSQPAAPQVSEAAKSGGGAVVGGLIGGGLVFVAGYLYYHFSGAKTVVNTASGAKSSVENAFKNFTDSAPEPNQALDWLRDTTKSYAKFIPGASVYVDQAFKDVDKVREKHGDEVEKIVSKAYDDLKEVTKKGASLETAAEAWGILENTLRQIGSLAADAGQDILNNHPQLKEKVGGRFEELKQMGDEYGPEAKKQVDETWKQVQDIVKGGIGVETISKIQKLIQEKTEQMKKYGDQAWQKGMEEAKPLLDKKPELKETFEKNKDKLLKGDLGQLWQKVQEAAKSGNTDDLQKFVKEQTEKAQQKGSSGFDQLLGMIPGGDQIGPQLQKLQELSQKHGKEAEDLVKSTIEEIKGVLKKKLDEGTKLKEKAESDAKSASK